MRNLLEFLFPRHSSSKEERLDSAKPIVLEVKILEHSFRCGYRINFDEQYIVTVEPTDEEMCKRFGRFEVYSHTVHQEFRDGEITKLPFVYNPKYEPECGDEPLLIFYTYDSLD